MDIARLNELKELVNDGLFVDWSQGLDEDWYKRLDDDDANVLLALIDAEIARQTPDTEIDDAIAWATAEKRSVGKLIDYRSMENICITGLPQEYRRYETIITALRKMKGDRV